MPAPRFLDPKGPFTPQEVATSPAARLVTAASLGLYLIKLAKARTWADLGRDLDAVPQHVMLESWQVELLVEHDQLLHVLRQKVEQDGDDAVTVTIAACTGCHGWLVVASTTSVPSKCSLTLGCEGALVKASAAGPRAAAKLGPEPLAEDEAEDEDDSGAAA